MYPLTAHKENLIQFSGGSRIIENGAQALIREAYDQPHGLLMFSHVRLD